MAREAIRVVIVTALKLEFQAVCAHLSDALPYRHPQGSIYRRGKFSAGDKTFDALVVEAGQGNNAAAAETTRAIDHFQPRVALFVGVSGGIKDVQIGDVVAANKVFNFESGKSNVEFQPRPDSLACAYALVEIAKEVSRNDSWHRRLKGFDGKFPASFVGPVLAAEKLIVSRQSQAFDLIKSTYSHCLIVEMEAFGFLRAAYQSSQADALVIRGVSDTIEGKSAADATGSQPNAAANAAAFAFEVLAGYGDQHQPPKEPAPIAPIPAPSRSPDELRQCLLDASQTVLRWQTTVKGGHRIKTPAEDTILEKIAESDSSTTLILGPKGVGKSALSAAIGNRAVNEGCAVVAIRADRLPASLDSEEDLSLKHLQLPVKLAEAISVLTATQKVLVLIDQLDSVSELTDRKSNRLNLLLNAINRLSGQKNVHIVAASREFDYRHDARLSSIQAEEVRLEPPPWEEVAPVLRANGIDPEAVSSSTRELLRIPWHLNLYLRLWKPGTTVESLQALIEMLWNQTVTNPGGAPGRVELIERMAQKMSQEEELFVPRALADDLAAAREALLHEDIIVEDRGGKALAFRHQTYYDHALARLFAAGKKSLAQHVLGGQDGLFVRPAMLSGLELLRSSAPTQYREEINTLLAAHPRLHIYTLLLEYLARQTDPQQFEAEIVLPLLEGEHGPLLLRAASGSQGWFVRLRESSQLAAWMKRPSEKATLCVSLLIGALSFDPDGVRNLITRYWLPNSAYDQLILSVAQYLAKWDKGWVDLVCEVVRRSELSAIWLADTAAKSDPSFAPPIIRAQLERELESAEKKSAVQQAAEPTTKEDSVRAHFRNLYNPFTDLIDTEDHDRYMLREIAEKSPKGLVDAVWLWLQRALEHCRNDYRYTTSYTDDYATWMAYDVRPIPLIEALHTAVAKWAETSPVVIL